METTSSIRIGHGSGVAFDSWKKFLLNWICSSTYLLEGTTQHELRAFSGMEDWLGTVRGFNMKNIAALKSHLCLKGGLNSLTLAKIETQKLIKTTDLYRYVCRYLWLKPLLMCLRKF